MESGNWIKEQDSQADTIKNSCIRSYSWNKYHMVMISPTKYCSHFERQWKEISGTCNFSMATPFVLGKGLSQLVVRSLLPLFLDSILCTGSQAIASDHMTDCESPLIGSSAYDNKLLALRETYPIAFIIICWKGNMN